MKERKVERRLLLAVRRGVFVVGHRRLKDGKLVER